MLTVLLGGARSGKSTAALKLAHASGGPVTFIATSPHINGDVDLDQRIAAHQAERPPTWTTVEEETALAEAIGSAANGALVVIDCLTVWLGNLMHHGRTDDEISRRSHDAREAARSRDGRTIVVTNEVGLGIVPADGMTRRYRDLLGHINQQWVEASDESYLMIAGRALPLNELGTDLA